MKKLIVGITGASGAPYALRLLDVLMDRAETHLIMTPQGERIIATESDHTVEEVSRSAAFRYDYRDFDAPPASGSALFDGMVVLPCSMNSLSAIAHSRAENLLTRAADVTLKECRRLILVPRETPLHLGHLENMQKAARMGAIICPPVPSFYFRPETIADLIDQTVGRILDLLQIPHTLCKRWGDASGSSRPVPVHPEEMTSP